MRIIFDKNGRERLTAELNESNRRRELFDCELPVNFTPK